mmetsp:Transcript_32516/g.74758  ORF Transcript_32516/g.74758 Transcript_32516/m.74758 type:complete len:243 (-) Transcript_32516:368-1096(-)
MLDGIQTPLYPPSEFFVTREVVKRDECVCRQLFLLKPFFNHAQHHFYATILHNGVPTGGWQARKTRTSHPEHVHAKIFLAPRDCNHHLYALRKLLRKNGFLDEWVMDQAADYRQPGLLYFGTTLVFLHGADNLVNQGFGFYDGLAGVCIVVYKSCEGLTSIALHLGIVLKEDHGLCNETDPIRFGDCHLCCLVTARQIPKHSTTVTLQVRTVRVRFHRQHGNMAPPGAHGTRTTHHECRPHL